jgi:hypothetical protein
MYFKLRLKIKKPMHDFSCFEIDAINTFPNLIHDEFNLRLLSFVYNSIGLSSDSTNDGQSEQQTSKTFPTMLKLISGALIGGVNYKEIYMDSDIDDKQTLQLQPITWVYTKIQIYTKYQPCLKQLEKRPD